MRLESLSVEEFAESERIASAVYVDMSNRLDGAVRRITGDIHCAISEVMAEHLQSDTASNFRNLVSEKVRSIMDGLLNTAEGAEDRRSAEAREYLAGFHFEGFRANVYAVHRDTIQNELIEDLKKENATLRQHLEIARQWR